MERADYRSGRFSIANCQVEWTSILLRPEAQVRNAAAFPYCSVVRTRGDLLGAQSQAYVTPVAETEICVRC